MGYVHFSSGWGEALFVACGKFFLHDFYIGGLQKVKSIFIRTISDAVDDAGDAGVDQCLGAIDAWQMRDVTSGAFG